LRAALIFNGIFEAQISRRIRAKSHFLPGKKFSAAAVYHPPVNDTARFGKSTLG
jgi:hypothetical protein